MPLAFDMMAIVAAITRPPAAGGLLETRGDGIRVGSRPVREGGILLGSAGWRTISDGLAPMGDGAMELTREYLIRIERQDDAGVYVEIGEVTLWRGTAVPVQATVREVVRLIEDAERTRPDRRKAS